MSLEIYKNFGQISCGLKNVDKLGVQMKKFKNTLQGEFFWCQYKNRLKKKIQN